MNILDYRQDIIANKLPSWGSLPDGEKSALIGYHVYPTSLTIPQLDALCTPSQRDLYKDKLIKEFDDIGIQIRKSSTANSEKLFALDIGDLSGLVAVELTTDGSVKKSGVIHHRDKIIQTTATGSIALTSSATGVPIEILTQTITAQKAGNHLELFYEIGGEVDSSNIVFKVFRDGTILPDSSDGSNNRHAGISTFGSYESDFLSTPTREAFSIVDKNTLSTPAEYKVHIVLSGGAGPNTFKPNRSFDAIGNNHEQTMSSFKCVEYVL